MCVRLFSEWLWWANSCDASKRKYTDSTENSEQHRRRKGRFFSAFYYCRCRCVWPQNVNVKSPTKQRRKFAFECPWSTPTPRPSRAKKCSLLENECKHAFHRFEMKIEFSLSRKRSSVFFHVAILTEKEIERKNKENSTLLVRPTHTWIRNTFDDNKNEDRSMWLDQCWLPCASTDAILTQFKRNEVNRSEPVWGDKRALESQSESKRKK